MSGRVDTPAFYEERLRLLEAERHHLRSVLAKILVEASSYHGGPNRKDNALHSIVVKARAALDEPRND